MLIYDAGTAGREVLSLKLTLQSGVAGSGDEVSPPGACGAFPPIKGKRSSPLCTAVWHRAFGRTRLPAQPCTRHQHKEGLVPVTAAQGAAVTSTLSPSVPQGRVNARAASELRRSVGAGNPHHNITLHCITPRINGGAPKERRQVGKGLSRSKALPAAGYTTRRYVKLLRQSFVGPFSVCPARS